MLAASPLAAMRSAPVITTSTAPVASRNPAALSATSVCGTPASRSSQAVNRPWLRGRVSLTTTSTGTPSATAVKTGASAVPIPHVASQPALQWVSTRTGPPRRSASRRRTGSP